MMRNLAGFLWLSALTGVGCARPLPEGVSPNGAVASNVVLITIDGLRWQEVFGGADRAYVTDRRGGAGDTTGLLREFWHDSPVQRRESLLPFVWSSVAQSGIMFGDSTQGSDARITNTFKFSYPGYNEILTGAADARINSNDFAPNPNETVFEWLAAMPAYKGRVAAVATWSAFTRIFNAERAGIPVQAGWTAPFDTLNPANERQATINDFYRSTARLWADNVFDSPMMLTALERVRADRPRVLFVGFGETDEWAHEGRYDRYLRSARQTDAFIGDLWRAMQAVPQYRGKTTFIVTADHGRGATLDDWRNHGRDVVGAERIWIAVFGAGVASGSVTGSVTQSQIAATVAALLGHDWTARRSDAGRPLPLRR